jgi:EAL domain-containing protein (putative c-di-GMP-specific phosphodiesterase class I)
VQLASSLGMKTTAEGVEMQGESDYLKRTGCTEAQGILFGKAGPPEICLGTVAAGRSKGKIEHGMRLPRGCATRDDEDSCRTDPARAASP